MFAKLVTATVLAASAFATSAAEASSSPGEVAELVAALGDADADVRALAAELLGETDGVGSVGRSALVAAVEDRGESWRVRSRAAEALVRLAATDSTSGHPLDAPAFAALVTSAVDDSDDWRVRHACVEALAGLDGGLRLGGLVRALPDGLAIDTPHSRIEFAGDGAATLHALSDPDPRVRRLAALALSTTLAGGITLDDALIDALRDEDDIVRRRAADALLVGLAPPTSPTSPTSPGPLGRFGVPGALSPVGPIGAVAPPRIVGGETSETHALVRRLTRTAMSDAQPSDTTGAVGLASGLAGALRYLVAIGDGN